MRAAHAYARRGRRVRSGQWRIAHIAASHRRARVEAEGIEVLLDASTEADTGYDIALIDDEKPRLVHDLGLNMALILRSHGLLTVGATVADAFLGMFNLQRACEIQVLAQAGGELVQVNPMILAGVKKNIGLVTKGMGGNIAWPALLRKLDREDGSYKS